MHSLKLCGLWKWKGDSSVPSNQHIVPLVADADSNQDVESGVTDVRARETNSRDSPSFTARLDGRAGEELSPPELMKGLPPTPVDIPSAERTPHSLHQTPSTSSLSAIVKRSTSSRTLRSDQKRERLAANLNTSNDQGINGRESVASRRSDPLATKPRATTVWSSDDSFLPRAKPPPPLITKPKHNRSGSTTSASPPSTTNPRRPSTSYQTDSHRKLSKQPQEAPQQMLHPTRPSSARSNSVKDTSPRPRSAVHRLSNSHSNIGVADALSASARISRKPSVASVESDLSDNSLAPGNFSSAWKWTPPACWAGPPGVTALVDQHAGDKQIGRSRLVRKNSAKGSLNRHVHVRPNLPSQDVWRPQSVRLAEIGTPEEASVREEGRLLPDVIVKVQSADTDEWHESGMADVIPHLRALRSG